MLVAKSLYLGGELIEAPAAQYKDTIDLGLTCPLCGKPVFLVKDAERLRQGKTEKVTAHFSHFKADSEAGKLCEARVLSKEGKAFLVQLSSEARGQRLKLFNRRLWEMIAWQKKFPKNLDKWLRRNAPPYYEILPDFIDHCWRHWQDPGERSQIKQVIPKTIGALNEVAAAQVGVRGNPRLIQEALQSTKEELDTRLQWLIAEEVVDYLAQPIAKEVFANLVRLAVFDALPTARASGEPIHSNGIHYLICCSIGLTRWVAALEHFKSPRSGEGFGAICH